MKVLAFMLALLVVLVAIGQPALPMSLAPKAQAAEPASSDFDDIAFELISRWEGKRNNSYRDIVGVWTICYGHTRTAGPGQRKTDAQCKTLLVAEIQEYREGLHAYLSGATLDFRLPAARDAAYTSLAFNVGIRGAGRSTAVKRLNAGDIAGGCKAITWWNKAGKRVVRGLVNRRGEEYRLCMVGVS